MAPAAARAFWINQRRLCDQVRVRRVQDTDGVGTFDHGMFSYSRFQFRLELTVQVVPRASAVVPGAADAEPIVIHADHINMVKFGSKEDSGYKTVSGHLQIMAESAGGVVSSRWEKECRVSTNLFSGLPQTGTHNSCTVVQIEAMPLHLLRHTDRIRSWQGYWHENMILPAEEQRENLKPLRAEDYQSLQRGPEQLVELAIAPSAKRQRHPSTEQDGVRHETPSPELLLKLAEFMTIYQDELMAQLELFPNIYQQRALFGAMLRMTRGNLEKDGDTGRTLLHWFAMNDVHCLMPKLVEIGFGVNDRDSDYRTPLHLAVVSNNYWSVEALINECHADPNVEDLCYLLPWHLALAIDDDNVIENAERARSKADIIVCLARHTDASKIKGNRSLKILKQLQDDPNAEIVFTLPGSSRGR